MHEEICLAAGNNNWRYFPGVFANDAVWRISIDCVNMNGNFSMAGFISV